MTNSFFNFTESPDFGSILADSYGSVNQSYDRREELEQENDKTRLKNAEMPLKLIKELIEFSPKAKEMADGLAEQRRKGLLSQGYKDIPEIDLESDQNTLTTVFDIGKAENFIKNEALKNGDNTTYETIDLSGPHGARRRLLMMEEMKTRLGTEFTPWVTKNYPAGFNSVSEARMAFDKYKQGILTNADQLGFNLRFTKNQLKDSFAGVESKFYETTNQNITSKNIQKEQGRMISEVKNALNSENPLQAFIETSEYNVGYFEGNIAKAERAFINIGLMGMKKGVVNIDKFESVLFGEITAKGDKTKLLIDKLGGGEENTLWAEGVLASIEEAKKGVFENKALSRTNYAKGFVEEIQKIEDGQDTRMTKLELAKYVQSNWDIKQGGSNLPEAVKNRFAKEEGDDILIRAQLDYKLNKGIPITKEEVLKLSDPFVEAQYLPKVADGGNPLAPSKDLQDLAKTQIKGFATTHAKQQGVAPGRESTQWNNIVENAEREYPILFAKHMQATNSAVDAHILALQDIQGRTNAKVYDHLVVNRDGNKIRTLNLIKAEEHIKTIDPNIVNTGLIFGTEDIVVEASKYPTGKTHLFYDQLADKIPGVTGAELQYKQVEIYNKMNGLEKPIKSDVLLAYEKLDPNVQFFLSHHPSPAKVARAKIEAFKDDAQIDYDEISLLVPEAQAVVEKMIKEDPSAIRSQISTEDFMNLSSEMQQDILQTPQLGKLEPRKGDWQRTDQGTFIVWNGDQWIERGVFATGNKQPFEGEINEYLDRDKVRRKI